MNRNGHALRQTSGVPSDGKQYTAKELRALKTHREALEVEQQIKRLTRGQQLSESWFHGWDRDEEDNLWLRIRGADPDRQVNGLPQSLPSDRQHGANWPLWREEFDLDRLRQRSRVLSDDNAYCRGLLKNLVNYIVYKGFTYKAQSKEDIDTDPETPGTQEADSIKKLEKQLQDFIDKWCKHNRWNCAADPRKGKQPTGTREKELVRRVYRDGEAFLRFTFEDDGLSVVRPIEPEQVRNGKECNQTDGWSFGIKHQMDPQTRIEDVETIEQYCVVYPGAGVTQEIIDADEVVHIKDSETDSTIKRGVPTFRGDVFDSLYRASVLQRNISYGAAVRAATAEYWEVEFGSKDQITAFSAGARQYQNTDTITGKQYDVEKRRAGGIVRYPTGHKPVPVPPQSGTVSEPQMGVQGDLRQAGSAHACPEFIISSDASNGNYASIREAGTPFVRNSESEQEHFKQAFLVVIWKAVQWAVEKDVLPKEVLELCDIQVEAAEVATTNKIEKAQVDQLLLTMNVKSRHTIAMEWGLDPEIEEANNQEWEEKHGGAGMGLGLPGEDDPLGGMGDGSTYMGKDALGRRHRLKQPEAGSVPGLESLQEGAGTCKQGERADLTGCSPATDDDAAAPQSGSGPDTTSASDSHPDEGLNYRNGRAELSSDTPASHILKHLTPGDAVVMHGESDPWEVVAIRKQVRTEPTFSQTNPESTEQGERKWLLATVTLANSWAQRRKVTFWEKVSERVPESLHESAGTCKQGSEVQECDACGPDCDCDKCRTLRECGGEGSGKPGPCPKIGTAEHDEIATNIVTDQSFLAKAAKLPQQAVNAVVSKAKNFYSGLEKKYGPRWAKAIVATAIITMPTPVTTLSVAGMTGLAHVWTKYVSKPSAEALHESAEVELTDEEVKKLAADLVRVLVGE